MRSMGVAQSNRWAALMQHGQSGNLFGIIDDMHSSPPTGEFSDRGDHGVESSVTHGCDGCVGGEPCGTCGGNISRASPAHLALQFAMIMSPGPIERFWRVAGVAQVLRDAPKTSDSAAWLAVGAMVSSSWSQALRAASPFVEEPADPRTKLRVGGDPNDFRLGDGEPDKPVPPSSPVGDGGLPHICCPIVLAYPDVRPTPIDVDFGTPNKEHKLGFKFTALAIFQEGVAKDADGNDVYCDCACCVFRQYVKLDELDEKGAVTDNIHNGEDQKEGEGYGHDIPSWQGCPQKTKGRIGSNVVYPQSCEQTTKSKDLKPEELKKYRDAHKIPAETSFCVYRMEDYPGVHAKSGDTVHASWCFEARIKSRCPKPCPTVPGFIEDFSLTIYARNEGGTIRWLGGKNDNVYKKLKPGECAPMGADSNDC